MGCGRLPAPWSGTKPQGLFNSASFSHRRPQFNSDRQILRYSVLLGIHYKFYDDWWITSVPAMRLQKWRISLNREFLLICDKQLYSVQSFKINQLKECRRSGTSELQKITQLSIIGHFDDFQEIWAWRTRVQNLKTYVFNYSIVHFRTISSVV